MKEFFHNFHYKTLPNDTILTDVIKSKALFQKLPLKHGESFLLEHYASPKFETPWHFHDEYELVYCEKGFGKRFIGDSFHEYQEGELYLLGKNLPHWFKADDSFYNKTSSSKPASFVLQFLEDFLGESFFETPEMRATKSVLERAKNGIQIVGTTRQKVIDLMYQIEKGPSYYRLSRLIEIFAVLGESMELIPVSNHPIRGIENVDSEKMHVILEYALQNYRSQLKVEDVAQLVAMSTSAFCRYFKSRTQKTFMDFVLDLRIDEAKRLLKKTNQSILNISYESGFNNLSNFNRQFRKRTGMNPRAFKTL